MPLKSELTSDGKYVVLKGRVQASIQAKLLRYKVRAMQYKVPLHTFCSCNWTLEHDAEALPQQLLHMAQRTPASPDLDAQIMKGLYPFQEEAVRYIIGTLKGRAILADDMGLGKTRQAMALLKYYGPPCLIICPAFMQANWIACAKEHALKDVTIVSFDKLRKQNMSETQWNAVAVDEAHYIKQKDAQRTKAALPIIMNSKCAVLCTGTPCPNRCEELFTLMHALRPSIVSNFQWFATRYCNARKTRFSAFDTTGASRQGELQWLLRRAFMVRRTKDQVLAQLPMKHQSRVWVHCTQKWVNSMAALRDKFEDAMDNNQINTAKCIVSEMFRKTCQAKLQPAVEYAVNSVQKCKSCCLLFAHHQAMLDALEDATKHLNTVRIDGKTPMQKRTEAVRRLQEGQVQAAILSMGAAGVGLTMTRANRVLFLELPWTPAMLKQCEDRVHRIGQCKECFVTYVLAENTLDEHMWDSIQGKQSFISSVL